MNEFEILVEGLGFKQKEIVRIVIEAGFITFEQARALYASDDATRSGLKSLELKKILKQLKNGEWELML